MQRIALALAPLLIVACADHPAGPLPEAGPDFNTSAEHAALVIKSDLTATLFDGDGVVVPATCQAVEVYTNAGERWLNLLVRCELPNTSGRAVVYTEGNNPIGPGACGRWFDPDGNQIALCDWREVLSASGQAVFTARLNQ